MVKVAPVCHIAPTSTTTNPLPKNLPGIPPATDLKSALAAIAAMRQIIQIITNQQPVINVTNNYGGNGSAPAKVQWSEKSRVSETVRIYNPTDKTQYVDVERINSLTMVDKNSGQTWAWQRTKS